MSLHLVEFRTSTSNPGHHQTAIQCLAHTLGVDDATIRILDSLRKCRVRGAVGKEKGRLKSLSRLHLIRFHGVLEPNAKLRSKVVPAAPQQTTAGECDCQHTHCAPLRLTSARLLKRVFDSDVEQCACGGKLKLIAVIEEPDVIEKTFKYIGPESGELPLIDRLPRLGIHSRQVTNGVGKSFTFGGSPCAVSWHS